MASNPPRSDKRTPLVRDHSSQFERDTNTVAKNITSSPLYGGKVVSKVVLSATTTLVPHPLGKPYSGWYVVDKSGTGDVWRDFTVTTQLSTQIALKASGSLVVSIFIF